MHILDEYPSYINWPTTSLGPKKKSIQITKRRIDPCPAHTARSKGSFTSMVLWITQGLLSSTVYFQIGLTLIFHIFPERVDTISDSLMVSIKIECV